MERLLPPRLLDRDLQLRRQPNLADAVAMGQAATPEEERDVGQSSLLSADQDQVIAHPPPGSIETMFIKGLGIQAGSEPILPILERSAWGGIRGRMLK